MKRTDFITFIYMFYSQCGIYLYVL